MSLSDLLADWKNSLIAHPRFQAFAMANPLMRPIANRKAAESFDLVAGFVYSQILVAAVETGLLDMIRSGPVSVEAYCVHSRLPPDGATRLLLSASSLGLVRRRRDGLFGLGEMGAALLANPSVFAMIRHHRVLYADLHDLAGLLAGRSSETGLARFWAYGPEAGAGGAGAYSELMAETQSLIAEEIIRVARLGRYRSLMDVGGGLGAFISRAGARHARLSLHLVDLPAVAELAARRLAGSHDPGRLQISGVDFLSEPLPGGADVVTLIRILHDHDDAPAMQILRNIREALPPEGRLILAEPMAGERGAVRMGEAYFGMYLWAMGRGRPRHLDEICQMLRAAGFARVRRLKTRAPLLISAIEAG